MTENVSIDTGYTDGVTTDTFYFYARPAKIARVANKNAIDFYTFVSAVMKVYFKLENSPENASYGSKHFTYLRSITNKNRAFDDAIFIEVSVSGAKQLAVTNGYIILDRLASEFKAGGGDEYGNTIKDSGNGTFCGLNWHGKGEDQGGTIVK